MCRGFLCQTSRRAELQWLIAPPTIGGSQTTHRARASEPVLEREHTRSREPSPYIPARQGKLRVLRSPLTASKQWAWIRTDYHQNGQTIESREAHRVAVIFSSRTYFRERAPGDALTRPWPHAIKEATTGGLCVCARAFIASASTSLSLSSPLPPPPPFLRSSGVCCI